MIDLFRAVEFTARLRSDFKSVADLLGPSRAFYAFAGEVVKAELDPETEERFVAIIRALFDDYQATPQPESENR